MSTDTHFHYVIFDSIQSRFSVYIIIPRRKTGLILLQPLYIHQVHLSMTRSCNTKRIYNERTLASRSANLPFMSEIVFTNFLFSSFTCVTSMFCLVAPVRNSWIYMETKSTGHQYLRSMVFRKILVYHRRI